MFQENPHGVRVSAPKTIEDAVAYLAPVALTTSVPEYAAALHIVLEAARDKDAAVSDLERLLWIGGPCAYCAKNKGRGGHSRLDRPCIPCEPKWRGRPQKKEELLREFYPVHPDPAG